MKLLVFSVLALSAVASAWSVSPRSTVECSYDTEPGANQTCSTFASDWDITIAQLEAWNPGLTCTSKLNATQNYCVIGTVVTSTAAATTSTSQVTTSSLIPTTSSSPYQPQQSGLAANCNAYYQVASGDSCESIEFKYAITAAEFSQWNPAINSQCSNLFASYYVCVGVPGASHTSASATTTTPSNGITTPTPTQSGMTGNCNEFYNVQSGDSCDAITSKYGISLNQFYSWNPTVGNSCTGLWVSYYVCVGVIGEAPPTTTPGNGIATPTPTQSGMVGSCDSFYDVQNGDNCDSIASNNNIPVDTFYQWNPAVGSSCQSLWVGYYVCVDTQGYTPTTTSPGNGVTTPTPYEPGMVSNCNSFYYVQSGDTCQSIAQNQGITAGDIEYWNPQVGSSCTDLWSQTYICVGVM